MELYDVAREMPWLGRGLLHLADRNTEPALTTLLGEQGFAVYRIEGSRVVDKPSLFPEMAEGLRFPDYFGNNWDALIDSLGRIGKRPERRVAIFWRNGDVSAGADLGVFCEAVHWILAVRDDLLTIPDEASGDEDDLDLVQIELFIFGRGGAFRRPGGE